MANEVKIMYSLNHPYILKLYNHFEDEINIYLILEFVGGVHINVILGITICSIMEIAIKEI
jgi:serine/threonine protein kinase